ncbi:hypothetical protein [Occultella gossypii]|uniref:DUF3592 domain-containing protein n=1 Tax=Occultella gossypii TaxID=2800820 RepID=A0ABS7S376_9MICO|nr:hypothetical protein [Occultella gossypii]MBZ2194792.1 hypothetical protein [Occultella gossypii]
MGAGTGGDGQRLLENDLSAPPGASSLVLPSGPLGLVVRALIAALMVAGLVQIALQPVERMVDELRNDLRAGRVSELTIERLPTGTEGSGTLRVEWSGHSGRSVAWYEFSNLAGEPRVDEGAIILADAEDSPEPVSVTYSQGWDQPATQISLAAFAAMAALILLVVGPAPRLATKWAWFWLTCAAAPIWLAYLVLEPVPWWQRRLVTPRPRRLTGGWGFVAALLLVPFVLAIIPGGSRFYGW